MKPAACFNGTKTYMLKDQCKSDFSCHDFFNCVFMSLSCESFIVAWEYLFIWILCEIVLSIFEWHFTYESAIQINVYYCYYYY